MCVVVCEHMQIKMSTKIKVTEKKLVVTSKGTCAAGGGKAVGVDAVKHEIKLTAIFKTTKTV